MTLTIQCKRSKQVAAYLMLSSINAAIRTTKIREKQQA